MALGSTVRLRFTRIAAILAALVTIALLVAAAVPAPRPAPFLCTPDAMSDDEMTVRAAAHYSSSPPHGAARANVVAVDTFLTAGLHFNGDHNTNTLVDSVHILPGQSVMFKWVASTHTTTSGNYDDVTPGALWDLPLDTNNREQVVTFTTPGRYPFFCWYHYWAPMLGVIIVDDVATPTTRPSWGALKVRYR